MIKYTKWINNCVVFILDEIQYEFKNVKIDQYRNVIIVNILENYISLIHHECDLEELLSTLQRVS